MVELIDNAPRIEIARRILAAISNTGKPIILTVRIFRPTLLVGSQTDCSCEFEIHGVEKAPYKAMACGVDSVQAIQLAFRRIEIDLGSQDAFARLTIEKYSPDGFGFA